MREMRAWPSYPAGTAWVFLVSVVLAAFGCSAGDGVATEAEEGPGPSRAVVTAVVKEAVVAEEIVLSAEVAPWAAVTVTAEISGRVVAVPVDVGDPVDQGQSLAELDPAEARAQLQQAEAGLLQARATAAQAERDAERGQQLAETNDISVGELDALELARDTAQARVLEAEAAVTLARKRLRDTVVRAPFAGVVSERAVEIGSWLAPGAPVVRVVSAEQVKARAAASQAERARLRVGMPVSLRAAALPGSAYSGVVRVLGAESDRATGTYRVEAWVEHPAAPSGERLLPGMHATMVVELERIEALWAPRAALVETAEGSVVFVVEGGRARVVKPEVGRMTPELVEVVEGLAAGDRVVVQGQHVLTDGEQVTDS